MRAVIQANIIRPKFIWLMFLCLLAVTSFPNFSYSQQLTMCGGGTGGLPTPWTRSGLDIYYSAGRVGVKTATPGADLHVNGTLRFQTMSSCGRLSTNASGDVVCSSYSAGTTYTVGGENYLSLVGSQITAGAINLSGSNATGTLAAGRFPALTGDVTNSAGSLATTIANNAVTTAKIADNSVNGTKIALGSDAQGDVMYYNGTDWARLSAGTSGQFLQTQGGGANPAWATVVTTEDDPQVGANTLNYLSKWNSSALVASAVFESGGNVGIGTSSPIFPLHLSGTGNTALGIDSYSATAGLRPSFIFRRARGSEGSPTAVSSGDLLGSISFESWDTDFSQGAMIYALAAADWGTAGDSTDNPTDLVFSTAPDGSIITERMRLTSSGNLGIGSNNPSYKLDVNGAIRSGQSGTAGSLRLAASSGNELVLAPASGTGNYTLTFPTDAGANGEVLTTNGSGVLSWAAVSGGHDAVTLAGENYLSLSGQQITAGAINLSGTHATGTLAAARFPALTGDVTTSAGSLATTIANNAVTSAKIADNNVNGTKIALGSDAQGDVMYYNGTDWARLGAGTSGYFLKTNGAGANPAWAAALTAESDPEVGANSTSYVPRWNGSALVSGVIQDNATNVGIGGAPSSYKLDISGNLNVSGGSGSSKISTTNGEVNILNGHSWGNILPASTFIMGITALADMPAGLGIRRNTSTVDWALYENTDDSFNIAMDTNTGLANPPGAGGKNVLTILYAGGQNANSGNVGIDQTSPAYKLDVNGAIRSGQSGTAGSLRLAASSGNELVLAPAAGTGNYTLTFPTGAGTNGQVLTTNGSGTLSWTTVSGGGGDLLAANNLSDVASAATSRTNLGLAIGTNVQAYDATLTSVAAIAGVQGDLMYASGSDAWTRLAKNTTATRYLSNTGTSNNPAWAQINLANGVTGTLPVANGGTGIASYTANNYIRASASTTLQQRTPAQVLSDIGAVGGSGSASYLPKFSASTTLANSALYELTTANGGFLGVNETNPAMQLDIKTTHNDWGGIRLHHDGNDDKHNGLWLQRSKGSGAAVSDGDMLGAISWHGATPSVGEDNQTWANTWGFKYGRMGMNATTVAKATRSGSWFLWLARNGANDWESEPAIYATGALSTTEHRVGIGTSSPTNTLHVNGTLKVGNLGGAYATHVCSSGGVLGGCSSSRRYKENIEKYAKGMEIVEKLSPVTYDWKDGQGHDIGLIAEDVEAVEQLFTSYKDGVVEGVKYDRIVTVLINALKEQNQEIKDMKEDFSSQIAELRAEIEALKNKD